jgi:DNA topoisomerase-1
MVEQKVSEHKCPACGKPLVYRFGKNGRFLGCSSYPRCEYTSPCDEEIKPEGEVIVPEQNIYLRMPIDRVRTDAKYGVKLAQQAWRQMERDKTTPSEYKCPACGKPMIYRTGLYGVFLGCSDYPKCKTVLRLDKEGNVLPPKPPPEPTGIKCYKCKDGQLVIRQSKKGPFLGCNRFPRCRTIVSIKQLEMLKKLQSEGRWPGGTLEDAEAMLGRKKAAGTAKAKN